MLKSREELNDHFQNIIETYVTTPQIVKSIADYCYKEFDLPRARTQTILNLSGSPMEYKENEIFWILVAMNDYNDHWNLKISQFYTDIEIDTYLSAKNPKEEIKFPLRFDMIQIARDQWIGKITAKQLISLRRADLITYNKAAQRRAKTIVRGGKETIRLNVVTKTVNSISKLLSGNKFIPNAITLNIADGAADFYYDEDSKQLIIKDIKSFDIIDGFHRYVALCGTADDDKSGSFDYPMEFRIVAFSEDKTSQFIWQEAQQTKMTEVDVKSYNTDDLANKIANRVATATTSTISEIVDTNREFGTYETKSIPLSHLANAIDKIYIKYLSPEEKKTAIVNIPKELIEDFNILIDNDPSLLTRKWKVYEIYLCVNLFFATRNEDKKDLYQKYVNVMKATHQGKLEDHFAPTKSSRTQLNTMEKLLEATQNV